MEHKFVVGDKVRVSGRPSVLYSTPGFAKGMERFKGKIVTLAYLTQDGYWRILEDNSAYVWDERWFIREKKKSVTITFDPSDRVKAHRMVDKVIDDFYSPEEWTLEEIEKAKDFVCQTVEEIFRKDGNVNFGNTDETICCYIYSSWNTIVSSSKGKAKPRGKDIYNSWIGRCVALCKALKRPIPDFIRFKNT